MFGQFLRLAGFAESVLNPDQFHWHRLIFRQNFADCRTHASGFLVLFPLNFVPGVGSAVWWVLSSLWSSFWIAAEHLSNPMARHLFPFGAVVRALWRRLPLAMGFGLATYAVLWVPVVNFFLMPLAVVSGTLLYRALLAAGAVAPGTNGGAPVSGVP